MHVLINVGDQWDRGSRLTDNSELPDVSVRDQMKLTWSGRAVHALN